MITATTMKNGTPDGARLSWAHDGQLLLVGQYRGGRLDRYYEWYPSGHLRAELRPKANGDESTLTMWYRTGQRMIEASVREGALHGKLMGWRDDGRFLLVRCYQQGDERWSGRSRATASAKPCP